MRKLTFLIACLYGLTAAAQREAKSGEGFFNHLDVGLSVGTTGIGVDLSVPVCPILSLRAGVDYMPQFHYDMKFGVHLGDDPRGKYVLDAQGKPVFDANGKPVLSTFGKLAEKLQDMTGYQIEDEVTMTGHPTLVNFKFLADFHPFRNKKWRITAGFFAGGSRVAKGQNSIEDAPSLFAVSIYNNIYERVKNEEPIMFGAEFPPEISERIVGYGPMGMVLGKYSHDILDADGNVTHQAGESYRMIPDEKSMVKTRLTANAVRPYLGFGYGGKLSKAQRIDCSFDCGLLYVGKTHIYTHDGTCLSHDVKDYGRSIKNAMNFFNGIRVYPVIDFRLAYRLF